MQVAEYLVQTLEQCGVRAVFGNPGTTEIPLLRCFEGRADCKYIVALSEVAAVPMADGYARATRGLGVVNLHVAPGLGNGMGTLYTAAIAKTPLLVLIGGQDRRLLHTRPVLHGPLEAMAASVCKRVVPLQRADQAPVEIRNALRAALTPPFGPVALVCPSDLLEEECDASPQAVAAPRLGTLSPAAAQRMAQALSRARSPAFIASEEVHWHRAAGDLHVLAEALNAPVYVAPYTGVLPIDAQRPAFGGYLSPGFASISERLREHDLLLFAGGRHLRTTLYSKPQLSQPSYWLGDDPAMLPASSEYEEAHLVDLAPALAALAERVQVSRRPDASGASPWRTPTSGASFSADALHPTAAIQALLRALPDAVVFDEAGLSTSDIRQAITCRAGDYLSNGSGGIGWGLAAAIGGALGCPQRQVMAIIGDGSALYASEAMWSAQHQGSAMLLVVLSNRRYATLNLAATKLAGRPFEAFTLEPPVLDFSGLATLYGWHFRRAATQGQLREALQHSSTGLRTNTLLELVLDPDLLPAAASRHF